MSSFSKFAYLLMAGTAFGAAPSLALAAAAAGSVPAQAAPQALEEVVVTARKASENLQRTPVAVTVMTEASITQKQVVNIVDIGHLAPNIQILSGAPGVPGFAMVAMRGEYDSASNSESDPAVAIYLDGIYIARAGSSAMNIPDLQDIQVLHGPQGTLFGRNTTGGAILVESKKPTDTFEGYLQGTVGNYANIDTAAMVNVPIRGDEVAARLVYRFHKHGGYAHNATTNQPMNDLKDDNAVRGSLRISPDNQPWKLLLTGDYERYTTGGQLQALSAVNPFGPLVIVAGPTPADVLTNLAPYIQNSSNFYTGYGSDLTSVNPKFFGFQFSTNYGTSATLDADLGDIKVKSISGYRAFHSGGSDNLAGIPYPALYSLSDFKQQQLSEELQLSGVVDKLSWTTGASYFTEWGTELSDANAFGFSSFENFGNYRNSSEGVFAQINYQLTDRLRATGGVRYTWDQRHVVIHNENPIDFATRIGFCTGTGVTAPVSACNTPEKVEYRYPAWLASLDFQATPTMMLYAKTSGASLSGGWNLRVTNTSTFNVPSFEPEGVKDVELGMKADWFEHRLRTNVALFHSWKHKVQQPVVGVFNGQTTLIQSNGGDAQVSGLEFQGSATPWEGMEIDTSVGWQTGKYTKGSYNGLDVVPSAVPIAGCGPVYVNFGVGGSAVNCPVDRSREPLNQLPKVTFTFGATQTVPLSFGKLIAHVDYSWTDSVHYYGLTAAPQQLPFIAAQYAQAEKVAQIPAYDLLNAMLTLRLNDPQVDISLWCKNCAGTKYNTWGLPQFAAYGGAFGINTVFVGDPKTYGVTVKYAFGGR